MMVKPLLQASSNTFINCPSRPGLLVSVCPRFSGFVIAVELDPELERFAGRLRAAGKQSSNSISQSVSAGNLQLVMYPAKEYEISIPAPTQTIIDQCVIAVANPLLADDCAGTL